MLRDEETVAARVLSSLDVSLAEVRGQVALIVGEGDELTTGQIPFTPRAKKVLELSLREAQRLGDNHIETEHLLLGLVRENEGVAARILLDFGVDAGTIRERVVGVGSGTWTPPPKPKPYRPASPPFSAEAAGLAAALGRGGRRARAAAEIFSGRTVVGDLDQRVVVVHAASRTTS